MDGLTALKFDPNKLREARERKNMKLVDAATAVGISKQSLWAYEHEDVRGTPDPDVLARLCVLYEVELSDLTNGHPMPVEA